MARPAHPRGLPALLAVLVVAAALPAAEPAPGAGLEAASRESYGLGVTAGELPFLRERGLFPDVVVSPHWALPRSNLTWVAMQAGDVAREAGRDVAVHWWYWGDQSTHACIERGECAGRSLSRADWYAKTQRLAAALDRHVPPDRRVVLIVETELNSGATADHEAWWRGPFADYMRAAAEVAEAELGGRGDTAVSLGAWSFHQYPWFQALGAPDSPYDHMGFQTHGTMSPDAEPWCYDGGDYQGLFHEKSLQAARALAEVTDKPLAGWDLFISSHHPDGAAVGEAEQRRYFADAEAALPELRRLGVVALLPRALTDWPGAPDGCLGTGEKHLGLVTAEGRVKPAFWKVYNMYDGRPLPPGRAEAERATHRSGGGNVDDAAAGNGRAWRVEGPAHLRQTFRATEDTAARPTVRLRAEGGDATVRARLNDVWVASLTAGGAYVEHRGPRVAVDAYRSYVLTVEVPPGATVVVDRVGLHPAGSVVLGDFESGRDGWGAGANVARVAWHDTHRWMDLCSGTHALYAEYHTTAAAGDRAAWVQAPVAESLEGLGRVSACVQPRPPTGDSATVEAALAVRADGAWYRQDPPVRLEAGAMNRLTWDATDPGANTRGAAVPVDRVDAARVWWRPVPPADNPGSVVYVDLVRAHE